jgi:hypothetical protein
VTEAKTETETLAEITFEPLPAFLQFYMPQNQDAPNEMELAVMHDAHRIYGPATIDACNGDAYKAARQISIMALAMTMRPGHYPDQAPKSDRTPRLQTVTAMNAARRGDLHTVPPGQTVIQALNAQDDKSA